MIINHIALYDYAYYYYDSCIVLAMLWVTPCHSYARSKAFKALGFSMFAKSFTVGRLVLFGVVCVGCIQGNLGMCGGRSSGLEQYIIQISQSYPYIVPNCTPQKP